MSDPIHILSLGAGVQSSTLALMAARGLVTPMPDCAIFADTQAEPPSVYRWLDWLENQLPFPVHRVTAGSLTERITTTRRNRKTGGLYYSNMIPAFSANADGSTGITGRACTFRFKIEPIQKAARRLGEIKRGQKSVGVVQWIGISIDEVSRMKDSREPWVANRWPLIEMRMKRHDCLRWMAANGYPTPPRSACSYCPFHSDAEWRRLRTEEPLEFEKACEVEKQLQAAHASVTTPGKSKGSAYLHASLKPLATVDFSTEEENGQTSLFQNECEGMCGI